MLEKMLCEGNIKQAIRKYYLPKGKVKYASSVPSVRTCVDVRKLKKLSTAKNYQLRLMEQYLFVYLLVHLFIKDLRCIKDMGSNAE